MVKNPLTLSAVTAVAVLTAACGGTTGRRPASTAPPPRLSGLEAGIAQARADSIRLPYTEADVRFMSGMIHHHAQAIVMAKWAATHGAGPAVQRLCERIVNAQTDEIALMSNWLRDRRQPVPEPNPAGMKMTMGGVEHVMLMPGMLTKAQMEELDAARGQNFDRLFLTFMIQHHRGAVTMVRELLSNHGAAQDETVFKFASDVETDQTTEINRMLEMLLSLGAPSPVR
jgi:uncharacterized protein (DUF305 family)